MNKKSNIAWYALCFTVIISVMSSSYIAIRAVKMQRELQMSFSLYEIPWVINDPGMLREVMQRVIMNTDKSVLLDDRIEAARVLMNSDDMQCQRFGLAAGSHIMTKYGGAMPEVIRSMKVCIEKTEHTKVKEVGEIIFENPEWE